MISEQYIVMDDGTELFVRTAGEGVPLLLIHGAMVDADFYLDMQEILAAGMQVITYDRRGYSRSRASAEGSGYGLVRQAEDAAQVLRALADGPAYVLGCSAGALIALKLMEIEPSLIRHMYMHEPAALFCQDVLRQEERDWLDGIHDTAQQGDMKGFRRAVLQFMMGAKGAPGPDDRAKPLPAEVLDRQMKNGIVYVRDEYPEAYRLTEGFYDMEALRAEGRITCLAGDSGRDGYCARAAVKMAERLGAKLYYVPGRHNGAHDLPAEFAASLTGMMELGM